MGLKILHSADWHLGAQMERALQQKLCACLGSLARGCDLALLAGDIFHGSPPRELVEQVKESLCQWQIPVFISPGNHDFCAPDSPWLETDWPENVHIFTGGLTSVTLPELDCRIYGAGYQQMDCSPLLEDFRAEGSERYCIGVFHGDGVNRSSPYAPVTAAQVRDSGFDYLALGHIHTAGVFRAGATLCGWPGCPMGQGWDECGEKGVYLVTLEAEAQVQFLPLGLPAYYQETVDVQTDAVAALDAVLPPGGSEDHYRITLTGTLDIDIRELKVIFSRFPNLELVDETVAPHSLWEMAGQDSLEGVYFSLLQQSEEPIALLAAEISRKLLMGKEVILP